MCDVLPAIGEETPPSSPDDGDNSKLEQLMISMLEERDKLMEKLRESQETYTEATKKLGDVESDNKVLLRQLQALMPQEEDRLHSLLDDLRASGGSVTANQHDDLKRWPIAKKFLQLARELSTAKERVSEKEEEVEELKSERNNTRLLLEHLECLVARHERSLRMTVVKRQTSSAGVSSEVEVLKALKSLFDHHKALDEKVRERLRTAQERNIVLEDELMLANQEIKSLQDENKRMKRMIQQRNSVRLSMCYDNISFTREQLALLEDRDQTIGDLQFSLDEKDAQLEEAIHQRDELAERLAEVEEELTMAIQEIKKLNTANKQMNDAMAEHSILESRVSELQSVLSKTESELSTSKDSHQGVLDQLSTRESRIKTTQDELGTLKFELKQKELALSQTRSHVDELMQKQNRQNTEAAMKKGSDEHRIRGLQEQLDLKIRELLASQEKEKMHESNVSQLQLTVDRMLNEARERQRTYSNEKKQLTDDKTVYQKKAEGFEKELVMAKQQNKRLKAKVENLRNQLEQNGPGSTSTPVMARSSSTKKSANNKFRYSWHVTDLDELLIENGGTPTSETSTPQSGTDSSSGIVDHDKAIETAIGESISDFNPSQFASMLEETISKMDKQLESMGENMEEAEEFDRVMQSVAEGTYHPSKSAMETFPHSSMPVARHSKRKMQPNAVSRSALFRVNLPKDIPEDQPLSPASTISNDSFSSIGNSSSNGKTKSALKHKSSFSKLFRRGGRGGSTRKKNPHRRASAPVMTSARRPDRANTEPLRDSVDFSDLLENSEEREEDRKKKSALLNSVLEQGTPFSQWDSGTIVAWLELWVVVPFWYIAAIRSCLQSGEMLANITESELETELGITNTLHRLKLRLAVQEIVSLTCITKHHRTTSLYGEMSHEWVSDYWLPSLGLPQYKAVFKAGLVDARMLEHLTKKDLRTVLKMVDSGHRNSLQYGITVLKKLDYNRAILEERRGKVAVETRKDVLVWSNDHVIQWVESLGLADFATNLRESGVHGGVIALDSDFDHDKLALALQIPMSSIEIRKQLKTEFSVLLSEGTKRASSESQSHGKIVRKLSKRLKVGSRKITMATMPAELLPMRPSSPVLYASRPTPLHQHSLLEESDSGSSGNTTTNSLDDHFDFKTDTLKEFST